MGKKKLLWIAVIGVALFWFLGRGRAATTSAPSYQSGRGAGNFAAH